MILARHLGLLAQMFELLGEFLPDIVHAQQILARVAQARLGFLAPLTVFRHPGGFLKKHPQFFRLRLNHARNHALLDDGIGARAQAGAEEDIRDIAPPHNDIVDVISGVAFALQHTLDGYLAVRRPLPRRLAQTVVEQQFHTGAINRLTVARAVKQHVLHGGAAQMACGSFAEHPTHRVNHIGFAAAVRPDDAHQLARHRNLGRVYKRFKTCKIDMSEAQFLTSAGRVRGYNPQHPSREFLSDFQRAF